jgi:hypothetical protein
VVGLAIEALSFKLDGDGWPDDIRGFILFLLLFPLPA